MRTWALTHDSIITRIVAADVNPFSASLKTVEVTGIPAQVGNTVDALGNVGPSQAISPAEATVRKRSMLTGDRLYATSRGVWLPAGDPEGALFDTSPSNLGLLSALAIAGADRTPSADGRLMPVRASNVFDAAGKYLAACFAAEAKLADDPDADAADAWPDNGEPDDKHPAPIAPVVRQPGTGIVPELTGDNAHVEVPAVTGTVEAPVVQPA